MNFDDEDPFLTAGAFGGGFGTPAAAAAASAAMKSPESATDFAASVVNPLADGDYAASAISAVAQDVVQQGLQQMRVVESTDAVMDKV